MLPEMAELQLPLSFIRRASSNGQSLSTAQNLNETFASCFYNRHLSMSESDHFGDDTVSLADSDMDDWTDSEEDSVDGIVFTDANHESTTNAAARFHIRCEVQYFMHGSSSQDGDSPIQEFHIPVRSNINITSLPSVSHSSAAADADAPAMMMMISMDQSTPVKRASLVIFDDSSDL
eukprot:ANDGO_06547.mRNA.1 hypothetical protein